MNRKINYIKVKDLFGVPNNDFELHFFDDLNILTGRNGSGKTSILKILWFAISGHFDILTKEIDFSYLKVITDLAEIEIKKEKKKLLNFSINFYDTNYKKYNQDFKNYSLKPIIDKVHSSLFFPTFRRVEGGYSIIPKIGENVEGNDLYKSMNSLSQGLSRESQSYFNHIFVAYASTNDLDRRLKDEIAFVKTEKDKINEDRIEKISQLSRESKNTEIQELIDQTNQELQKLESRFDDLHSLVNEYIKKPILLSDKLIIGTQNTAPIPSQRLSAGEKQLFAFLCYLVFSENKVIFIDEPEISMHPDWQQDFIPLLMKIKANNQFIIATHSDLIVAPYAHREIELKSQL